MTIGNDNILIPVELIREIGQNGQNSIVYLAKETKINREIVLKKIDKTNLDHIDYKEAIYLQEAKHPNVVEIKYAGDSHCGNFVYLAMPYYKNGSLKEKIKDKNITILDILRYTLGFLNGLHCIHRKNFLHLDIKPDNILISDRNEALLSDFGLVTPFSKGRSIVPGPMFTLLWTPEYFNYAQANIATDIYQIGITLYLLCNKLHFEELLPPDMDKTKIENAIKNGTFYKDDYLYHIPEEVKKIIKKCLNKDMTKRYSSVGGVINDLSGIHEDIVLTWKYERTSLKKYWFRDDGKNCSLYNDGKIETCINKKTEYSGDNIKYLIDFLKK